jgi:hypothetical protein
MTIHTTIAPHFDGLPRRKLAWSWATLALWALLFAGFVASVSTPPTASPGAELAGAPAGGGQVAEVPCPPTCSPSRG